MHKSLLTDHPNLLAQILPHRGQRHCPVNAFGPPAVFPAGGTKMQFVQVSIRTLLVLAAGVSTLNASDLTGVYAKIDRVVIENDTAQVWGVFAAAKPNDRNDYLP